MTTPRTPRSRPSVTQIEDALRQTSGIPGAAAHYLGVRLRVDVDPDTVRDAIARSPRLQQCVADATEMLLDLGDMLIVRQMLRGDLGTVIYYLSRRGAARGWGTA
jgi:hypothetical protein